MIHHISIDAHNPLRVANALAEILNGKTYKFLIAGSYVVLPFDHYGTHIVVFQEGDVWAPGADIESAKVIQTTTANFASSHGAISVPTTQHQIEKIAHREGWRVLIRKQGDEVPFSAIEFWVENRLLFEFFPPEFVPQYLQAMQPEAIVKILGQPIQPLLV
ncbi:MAG: hypothetical protein H7Y37_07000 [Anaerolineae bacterium]|nr:hypothetical protein [Gloeobacterales cyanobacterium ES-bin-313]